MNRGTYLFDPDSQRVLPKEQVLKLRAERKTHGRSTVHANRSVERGCWVWDRRQMKLVPRAEYRPYSGTTIIKDIEPYKAVGIPGQPYVGGRAQHRDEMRAHGRIEVGNEKVEKKYEAAPGLREDIKRALWETEGAL